MWTPKQMIIHNGNRVLIGLWVRGKLFATYNYKYTRLTRPGKLCGRSYLPGTVFRVRRGNGRYGLNPYDRFQDQFTGVVPSSIMHPNGDASRAKFTLAVAAWQALSDTEKKAWNKKELGKKGISGYNLFVQDYMLNHA